MEQQKNNKLEGEKPASTNCHDSVNLLNIDAVSPSLIKRKKEEIPLFTKIWFLKEYDLNFRNYLESSDIIIDIIYGNNKQIQQILEGCHNS